MYESRNITNIRALRNSPGIRQTVGCLQIIVAAKKSQPEQDLIFLVALPYFCRFVPTSYSLVDKVSREPVPKVAHHYLFGSKVILDRRKLTLVCWKNGIHCSICSPKLSLRSLFLGEWLPTTPPIYSIWWLYVGKVSVDPNLRQGFSSGVLPDRDNLRRFLRTKVN